MPEFQLDTSGTVLGLPIETEAGGMKPDGCYSWNVLDAFTQGYIEALFFTWPENEGDYIGGITSPGFSDLAPETLGLIIRDCATFQRETSAYLADAYMREPFNEYKPKQAGSDFWFSRCGHGVGYWDRPQLKADGLGDILTGIAADEFGNVDAYLGDNGRVYIDWRRP